MQGETQLAFLDEKAFANHTESRGPNGETVIGSRTLSLTIRDESALACSGKGQAVVLTPLETPFRTRCAFLSLGRLAVGAGSTTPTIFEGLVDDDVSFIQFAASRADARRAEGFSANGMEGPGRGLLVACGGTSYRLVAPQPWNSLRIIFNGSLLERGWPLSGADINLLHLTAERAGPLRNIVCDLLSLALHDERFFEDEAVVAGVEENVELLLDEAIKHHAEIHSPRRVARNSFVVARRIDSYISDNIGRPIYNREICKELGISARVLHDAITTVMQMPLQKYLKLKRLWGVRRALLNSSGDVLVKTIALDFGFWHLARFSAEYTRFFGETPSQTRRRHADVARSRIAISSDPGASVRA